MPIRFGFWVTSIVLSLFVLMFVFGWLIRYPDVINGQIIINTNNAPIKLIASTYGKLKLSHVRSMDGVKEGQVIAYIENSTIPANVFYIDSLTRKYSPNQDDIINISNKLPRNFSLGELNTKYYTFVNALQEFKNYKKDKLMEKQGMNLNDLLQEQKKGINALIKSVEMSKNSLLYTHKFYGRDLILFLKKVISESEFDKSEINYLSASDALQTQLISS